MGPSPNLENGMKSKREIRAEIRQKLLRQGKAERREASGRVQEALYGLKEFREAKCLLIYAALPEEVDTLPVIERSLAAGKSVVLPRVLRRPRSLELREIRNLREDLEKGSFGVLEPRASVTRLVRPEEVDCAVVPGIAFDRKGRRLGRGAGYFDRLLAELPRQAARVGLAFGFQVVDELPAEFHDEPVDKVLSA